MCMKQYVNRRELPCAPSLSNIHQKLTKTGGALLVRVFRALPPPPFRTQASFISAATSHEQLAGRRSPQGGVHRGPSRDGSGLTQS
jgi:hypothetical protein